MARRITDSSNLCGYVRVFSTVQQSNIAKFNQLFYIVFQQKQTNLSYLLRHFGKIVPFHDITVSFGNLKIEIFSSSLHKM